VKTDLEEELSPFNFQSWLCHCIRVLLLGNLPMSPAHHLALKTGYIGGNGAFLFVAVSNSPCSCPSLPPLVFSPAARRTGSPSHV
jgi:hypothetical protein